MTDMINIGTPDRPILVPIEALPPFNTTQSRGFWEDVATGSAVLPNEALDILLRDIKPTNSHDPKTQQR